MLPVKIYEPEKNLPGYRKKKEAHSVKTYRGKTLTYFLLPVEKTRFLTNERLIIENIKSFVILGIHVSFSVTALCV